MGLVGIPTKATGDTITASWANDLRDNALVLDARTAGDPGASGKLLVSSGLTSAVWTAASTAITNGLGYTPVNRAGDASMSGTFSGAADIQWGANNQRSIQSTDLNTITRAGFYYADNLASNTPTGGFCVVLHIQTPSNLFAAQIAHVGTDGGLYLRYNTGSGWAAWNKIWNAANDGPGSGSNADMLDGAEGANYLARANHTGTQLAVTISDFAATVATLPAASATNATQAALALAIADGSVSTAAKIANGIITLAKMDAAAADPSAGLAGLRSLGTGATQAAAGNHTHPSSASGSYVGNGAGARIITNAIGYQPRLVVVSWSAGMYSVIRDNAWHGGSDTTPWGTASGGSIDANGFTVPSLLNTSGTTYTWSAFP